MKKIGIIGTRRRDTASVQRLIEAVLWKVYEEGDWIVSGGCPKGGDRFAELIAKANGIPILTFYPNYKRFKQGAPIVRNTDIAENSDMIIACVVNPEDPIEEIVDRISGGTENTLRKFVNLEKQNIKKIIIV